MKMKQNLLRAGLLCLRATRYASEAPVAVRSFRGVACLALRPVTDDGEVPGTEQGRGRRKDMDMDEDEDEDEGEG